MSARIAASVLALCALAGLFFASFSTIDFVAHLDRQVHELHCSFAPGLVEADTEATGCKVTLMSPYSSIWRRSAWGGIPISLPAMAVFAWLSFRALEFFTRPAAQQRTAANILLVGAIVPTIASIVMGYIAYSELGAACKLCIGIYVASGVGLVAAIATRALAGQAAAIADSAAPGDGKPAPAMHPAATWGLAAVQLASFVGLALLVYQRSTPDFSRYIASCGTLKQPADPYGVMVPLSGSASGVPAIELLDPLCPACKAFEERLAASGLQGELHRTAVLFPLDQTCNWMVSKSLHPGACEVSKAILCARRQGIDATQVLKWAFAEQEAILAAEKVNPGTAAKRVAAQFPALAPCLTSAEVEADLNKSLRWAVANELPVMTPQLYIEGVKLCDEDTDLGMEWALSQLLERRKAGTLPKVDGTAPPPGLRDDGSAPAPASKAKPEKPVAKKPAAKKPAPELPSVADEPAADAKTEEPTP